MSALITVSKISEKEAQKLLLLDEGHFGDLKSIDIRPAKLTKTICGFANAEGGEIYIGIEDSPREWRGFQEQEAANAHLQVFDGLFPLGTDYQYTFLGCDSLPGLVLKIEIAKSRDIKTASDGTVYVRRGAQSVPIHDDERILTLKRDKGLTSFEVETVNCPANLVTNSAQVIEFMLEVVPAAEPDCWLKKQMVLVDSKPTVAAVLLFADEPQAILPKRSGVKIYRYKTSAPKGTRETLDGIPLSIEGAACVLIDKAVKESIRIIESVRVKTTEGLAKAEYPIEAIHEIVTNAVIHRDYAITDDIHIRIFDNRVEVSSPGTLAGHVTTENILEERFARNPVLVRLINKFPNPPNRDVGEGLNTAFESMRKMKLKEPVIDRDGAHLRVTLKHESLATPEEAILGYLLVNHEIANRHARNICYIESENRMKRILQTLVSQGLLESVEGRTRYNAAYQLTELGMERALEAHS